MSVLASSSNRFSTVVKSEYAPEVRFCRDTLTVNDAAQTMKVGAVLGKYIASPVGTAGSIVGTGNGVMGTITMTSNANLQLGTYTLKVIKAVSNAGDFELLDPQGKLVGLGQVAAAFATGGFAFTLADGSTDFIAGDTIPIVVSGTEKWKLVEATATNGTEVARAVFIADSLGNSYDTTIVVNTDTTVLALTRGPVIVSQDALSYGTSVDTDPEKATLYAQLKAVGIIAEVTK